MDNTLYDVVANDLAKAVLQLGKDMKQQEKSKNYIQWVLEFFEEELAEFPALFRQFLEEWGNAIIYRKYFKDNDKIEYEGRYVRHGLKIVCCANSIPELKRKFIEEVNQLFNTV